MASSETGVEGGDGHVECDLELSEIVYRMGEPNDKDVDKHDVPVYKRGGAI